MSVGEVAGTLAIGFAAGMASGLLGIGGGVLFVPGLVLLLGATQLRAEATSLLAIIPVAVVGAARQRSYDNLRPRDALLVGVLSPIGVLGGVELANVVSNRVLSYLFAGMLVYFSFTLARRAIAPER
ncbi:MAG TPA: sulfite exporter TauE/SafE family protein [Thermoleophilaceae bacterium]|nr:sulfite exporter TauE/SafE family protein [Thermoleophilaceae bacterium]